MSISGKSEAEAELEAVDLTIPSMALNSSTSGCEVEDFLHFKRGNIALIQRGSCPFIDKAKNAISAGASRQSLFFNEGNQERTDFLSTRLDIVTSIPIIGASFEVGNRLRAKLLKGSAGIKVRLKTDISSDRRQVQNIIAESTAGDPERVIAIGAHLDSVFSGPGIGTDNGSGSAAILSIAEKFAELGLVPQNKLRFLWFGADGSVRLQVLCRFINFS